MGFNISMILVNHPVDEDHRLQFVQKYNRSYQAKREVELESVLYPRNRAFYIGEHKGATIITNVDVPDRINYEAKWVGEFERKHPITSKLCKSFPESDVFCMIHSSVGILYNYSFFSNGLRVRHKRNLIDGDFLTAEEVGNLLPEETSYYNYSRILKIEPGRQFNYGEGIGYLHPNVFSSREYYTKAMIKNKDQPLNEYQFGYEVMMDVTKRFLGQRLDKLNLEKIKMVEYT